MPEDDGRATRAHVVWTGTLAFGLVNVPVELFSAYRTHGRASRARGGRLRMVTPAGHPVERRYVCPAEEREVGFDELVRGYEVEDGEFVVLTDAELAEAAPEKSAEIDLRRFVPADAIDPAWFQRAYYLAPAGKSNKAYRLLAAALEAEERLGLATFVMREREYLVAIIAAGGILRAEVLRFAEELRSPEDAGLPAPALVEEAERQDVAAAIDALMRGRLDEAALADEREDALAALARRKYEAGEDVLLAEDERTAARAVEDPDGAFAGEPAEVIDLTEVLRARLAGKPEDRRDGSGRRDSRRTELFDALTKGELYARAREIDLPGRSTMSKEELARALAEQGG